MSKGNAMQLIPVEHSYEWFDEMIPKAERLLKNVQQEQNFEKNHLETKFFNEIRDFCHQFEAWIRQLYKIRSHLDQVKNDAIKCELNKRDLYDRYSVFRGFFGK